VQGIVRLLPRLKLFSDGLDQIFQVREIPIVRAQPSGELPDSFHRIEIGTVGWQEVQPETVTVLPEPWLNGFGMMIGGIVHDDDHTTSSTPVSQKTLQKREKRKCIECLAEHCYQTSTGIADCPEDGNTLARRRMKQDGVAILGRYPHGAAGSMLLEMALILEPEVNPRIMGVSTGFFYRPVAAPGRHGRSGGVASAAGSPAS